MKHRHKQGHIPRHWKCPKYKKLQHGNICESRCVRACGYFGKNEFEIEWRELEGRKEGYVVRMNREMKMKEKGDFR